MTTSDAVKLTTYFGERARADGAFVADALVGIYARHGLATSLVMRGVAGFGAKHRLRTDRLLSLSEDLPMVAVAVDERPKVMAALQDVRALPRFTGLVTLERARLLTGGLDDAGPLPEGQVKLTIYLGRQERAGGRPADRAVVEVLHDHGVAGATVLLGVDGTAHGVRRRARLFGANSEVPLMVIAVGDGDRIGAALPALAELLPRPLATLERVQVCKRDGRLLQEPVALDDQDASGMAMWQKLTVFASERSEHEGRPLHRALVQELREAGAAGATSLRGIWGFSGEHAPHGDAFWQLRRRVPVVVTVVDRPSEIHRWFAVVDRVTDQTGLVTSEMVPTLMVRD